MNGNSEIPMVLITQRDNVKMIKLVIGIVIKLIKTQKKHEKIEKMVKHNISELMIYTYYNIENLNLLKLKSLLHEVKYCLFFCPDLWTQPKYFSKSKYLVDRVFKYVEKKIKNDEAFNTHIILTKISVLLKN